MGLGGPVTGAGSEADAESAEWVRVLGAAGGDRERGASRLHAVLLRAARAETSRRAGRLRISGPELDDIAHQAAADALVAVLGKLDQFRGESRFTTWAYKFVVFEVSGKIGRHFWRNAPVSWDAEDWSLLPDRFALDPAHETQWRALVDGVHAAVERDLTEHQRRIFVALVLNAVPLDALVAELGSNRNAVYKSLFDARRKVRASLVSNGYLDDDGVRRA
jgi:RNA polymerase sigma-70 factor, ECF subfamily